jgi:hypothetical protein
MSVDVMAFVAGALMNKGALVERDEASVSAILPPPLARALGLPDYVHLRPGVAGTGAIACGMGSPLLERLVTEARALVPVAWTRLEWEAPRASQAASLAARFVVRNGVVDLGELTLATAEYVVATFAYVAEADDRHEGTVTVAVRADGRSVPHPTFVQLVSPHSVALRPSLERFDASVAAASLVQLSERAVRAAIAPFVESVGRRLTRDHTRTAAYFDQLLAEARAPRRRPEPGALEAKLAHLAAERRAKLADLLPRFTVRVSVEPAVLVGVSVPVARAALRVRRRKAERILLAMLPPAAQALDAVVCEGCSVPTTKPAVCDDVLHVLCETCVPTAQGRPHCLACARARRGT